MTNKTAKTKISYLDQYPMKLFCLETYDTIKRRILDMQDMIEVTTENKEKVLLSKKYISLVTPIKKD